MIYRMLWEKKSPLPLLYHLLQLSHMILVRPPDQKLVFQWCSGVPAQGGTGTDRVWSLILIPSCGLLFKPWGSSWQQLVLASSDPVGTPPLFLFLSSRAAPGFLAHGGPFSPCCSIVNLLFRNLSPGHLTSTGQAQSFRTKAPLCYSVPFLFLQDVFCLGPGIWLWPFLLSF